MPKEVFFNLSDEKRDKITSVLRDEFRSKPFYKVNVKDIVEKAGIARGSFYQYFENLEDAYFTILNKETVDVHELFMKKFLLKCKDIIVALEEYATEIADILFDEDNYMIYKNRYLYWNEDLNCSWMSSHKSFDKSFSQMSDSKLIDLEKIYFVKSVIHSLIERLFREGWSKEEFIEKYLKHLNYLDKGVSYGNNGEYI